MSNIDSKMKQQQKKKSGGLKFMGMCFSSPNEPQEQFQQYNQFDHHFNHHFRRPNHQHHAKGGGGRMTHVPNQTTSTSASKSETHGNRSPSFLYTPKDVKELRQNPGYSNVDIFTFEEMKLATKHFRPDLILGEGGFGVVYRGIIDDSVRQGYKSVEVAIKPTIAKLQPLRAEAEELPLDIEYEDEHLLIVNKPPHMVVHPAPGNPRGTLVNAILNHCSLPNTSAEIECFSEPEDISEDDLNIDSHTEHIHQEPCSSIRPGIVHRLDKGTSGLLVVAKDEYSHAHLAEQFKSHTINRVYLSLTSGLPTSASGRVEIPIGRDLSNRIRMTAVTGPGHSGPARDAASRYKVLEVVANGGAAVVEWKLETGRTHQIRAHAKYLGIPLLGDDLYGGTKDMALSLIRPKTPVSCHAQLIDLISSIERPCLHAMVLGFKHPCTGKYMHFSCPPPNDFAEILSKLRNIGI